MAVTLNELTTDQSTSNLSSYSTASISPNGNRLVLAAIVTTRGSSTDPNTPTLSGNGITWTLVDAVQGNIIFTTGAVRARLSLYRGMVASPTSGAITMDMGGVTHSGCAWSIVEFDGVDITGTHGSGAVRQPLSGIVTATNSITINLSAFADTDNVTYAAFGSNSSSALTPGGSFTEIDQQVYATPDGRIMTMWQAANDTSVDATSGANASIGGIAIEIVAAGGGTPQFARPTATVLVDGWSDDTGGTTNLHAPIDETSANDADYIKSSESPQDDECKVRLGGLSVPLAGTRTVRYRYQKDASGDTIDLTVTLYRSDGTTVIDSETHTNIGTSVTAGSFTFTSATIPAVDYETGLVVGFKADVP